MCPCASITIRFYLLFSFLLIPIFHQAYAAALAVTGPVW